MPRNQEGRASRRRIFRRGRVRNEHGTTLVEVVIAVAIMGTSVVALVTGTGTLFNASAINRQAATASIVARDYAEALSTAVSQTTAWCTYAAPPNANPYGVVYTAAPSGYTVSAVYGACPTNSASILQIQTVTITATAPNGGTEVVKTIVRAP